MDSYLFVVGGFDEVFDNFEPISTGRFVTTILNLLSSVILESKSQIASSIRNHVSVSVAEKVGSTVRRHNVCV